MKFLAILSRKFDKNDLWFKIECVGNVQKVALHVISKSSSYLEVDSFFLPAVSGKLAQALDV